MQKAGRQQRNQRAIVSPRRVDVISVVRPQNGRQRNGFRNQLSVEVEALVSVIVMADHIEEQLETQYRIASDKFPSPSAERLWFRVFETRGVDVHRRRFWSVAAVGRNIGNYKNRASRVYQRRDFALDEGLTDNGILPDKVSDASRRDLSVLRHTAVRKRPSAQAGHDAVVNAVAKRCKPSARKIIPGFPKKMLHPLRRPAPH